MKRRTYLDFTDYLTEDRIEVRSQVDDLITFFGEEEFRSLEEEDKRLLLRQRSYMSLYYTVLAQREARRDGVDMVPEGRLPLHLERPQ